MFTHIKAHRGNKQPACPLAMRFIAVRCFGSLLPFVHGLRQVGEIGDQHSAVAKWLLGGDGDAVADQFVEVDV